MGLAHHVHWLNKPYMEEYRIDVARNLQCNPQSKGKTVCYAYRKEGLFLGPSLQVSQHFSCLQKCTVQLESSLIANIARDLPVDFTNWISLVRPRLPPALRVYSAVEAPIKINFTLNGSTEGYIWFKPIYWVTSGRYNILKMNNFSTREASWATETFLPLSPDGCSHVGIFGVQNSLPPENPVPISAPKLQIYSL
ncbi:hypothetical protein DSO57_1034301 [Entomophthora muscae]|uniref:Uncharacterized protein n=1 Tax=Entomophthora muscae TaxID=34485 RepID=A0ACC2RQU3_9FUNG|nr:hypothetical protein DSO57_1034301 [Entomophthora muscae]